MLDFAKGKHINFTLLTFSFKFDPPSGGELWQYIMTQNAEFAEERAKSFF